MGAAPVEPSARVAAFFLDWVIGSVTLAIVVVAFVVLVFGSTSITRATIYFVIFVFTLFAAMAFHAYFWARSQTPGKAIVRLEVVDRQGRPAGFGRMLVRELLLKGIVVGFLWSLAFIGAVIWYLWALWDKERRAPHDIILGTRVVRKL